MGRENFIAAKPSLYYNSRHQDPTTIVLRKRAVLCDFHVLNEFHGWISRTMKKKHAMRNVAVTYPAAVPWMALFIRGVADYADRIGGWNLTTSPPFIPGADELTTTVHNLRGWTGNGVIAAINNPDEARAARRLGIPVVNVSGAMRDAGQPRVMVDHYAIGRMAADHLLDRGHRRLAYCGFRGPWYSQQRCLGFAQRAKELGASCDVFRTGGTLGPRATWSRRIGPLVDWLRRLKPPVGLLAVHDYRARIVVDECARLGLNVPHAVAILGVDNDPTVCPTTAIGEILIICSTRSLV